MSIDLKPDIKNDWNSDLPDKEWLEELAKLFIPSEDALEKDHPEGIVQFHFSKTFCSVIGNKLKEIASRMPESKAMNIAVIIEDGIVQEVISNKEANILVIDKDIDDLFDEDDIKLVEGDESYVYSSIRSTSVEEERVKKIFTEVKQQE